MNRNLAGFIEGADTSTRTIDGNFVKRVYFNNAATTLPLKPVMQAISYYLPYYTYLNDNTIPGEQIDDIYENVRNIVMSYVGGDPTKDIVINIRCTTSGINLLSHLFYQEDPDQVIITTPMEHMASYLPFKTKFKTELVKLTPEGNICLEDLENKLNIYKNKVKLVSIIGATNLTGITPPIYTAAKLAHEYGAKIFVDVAQLVQHRPFNMKPHDDDEHIDFVAFSSHKCYSPYDGGALVGPYEFFEKFRPFQYGAHITDFVSTKKIIYTDSPKRYETGYPDIVGIIAMGEALKFLSWVGLKNIAEYEKLLLDYAVNKLETIPGVEIYGRNADYVNIPYISFNVRGMHYNYVAKKLGFEYGITVGRGTSGADLYTQFLLGLNDEEAYKRYLKGETPGVVRITLGMYNNFDEIDWFIYALNRIVLGL